MKLVEVYTSVQGEGPRTGVPTTFVRFGGCNLRCPGWGEGKLPDGRIVNGCDTIFAVYPEWRHTWEPIEIDSLLERIPEFPENICLTGGEPLIQKAEDLNELAIQLKRRGHTIDLFTNGSRPLPVWTRSSRVIVIADYKLPGSGEYGSFNNDNWYQLAPKDALKFVCKDRGDFNVAREAVTAFLSTPTRMPPSPPMFYFGPVWGELDPAELVEWMQELPFEAHLNLQTHKYVWDPNERKR
jgi:7-carboxy-7-deazaguanine synthase